MRTDDEKREMEMETFDEESQLSARNSAQLSAQKSAQLVAQKSSQLFAQKIAQRSAAENDEKLFSRDRLRNEKEE